MPLDELAVSRAPLSLVYGRTTGASPTFVTAIAIVATLNGVIIQIIMASRVLYGLAKQGNVPVILASVHPLTRTPLIATGLVTAVVLILALAFPLEGLAEWTSRIVLVIFALVNMSLFKLKQQADWEPGTQFTVGSWVALMGSLSCIALLALDLAF